MTFENPNPNNPKGETMPEAETPTLTEVKKRGPGRPPKPRTEIAAVAERNIAVWDDEKKALLKQQMIAGGSAPPVTDMELALAIHICNRTGLDPFARQIYFIKRKVGQDYKVTPQVSIDGFRLNAQRTGEFAGSDEYEYGTVNEQGRPEWARCTVHRIVKGMRVPFTATARWKEYVPSPGQDSMWIKMPFNQIGKCAEALALRKGFPAELSGLYTDDEMAQADNDRMGGGDRQIIDVPPTVHNTRAVNVQFPPPQPAPKPAPVQTAPAPTPAPVAQPQPAKPTANGESTNATRTELGKLLTEKVGTNDVAKLRKALKDLSGVDRSALLTEEGARNHIDALRNYGVEQGEDGAWKYRIPTEAPVADSEGV